MQELRGYLTSIEKRCGRVREGLLGIAVAEGAIACEIPRKAVVQHGRLRRERPERIDDSGSRAILDGDQIGGILGAGAVGRHDHRHRLADIAHTVDRDRPTLDRRLHADDEARCDGLDLARR